MMKTIMLLPLVAGMLAVTACGAPAEAEKAAEAASAETAAPAAPAAPAEGAQAAAAATPAGWRRITISGYTCGDNCYLEYTVGGNVEPEGAICNAPQCEPWFAVQAIPQTELGRTYDVRMGTGEQVDGEGRVMESEFPAIVEMRLVADAAR